MKRLRWCGLVVVIALLSCSGGGSRTTTPVVSVVPSSASSLPSIPSPAPLTVATVIATPPPATAALQPTILPPPTAFPPVTATSRITGTLPAVALEVKIGEMLMVGIEGTTTTEDARHLIQDLHVGNVVLLDRNVASPAQVLRLTQGLQALALSANGSGLLIGADQEGGTVQRLRPGFTVLPDATTVGAARRPDLAQALGRMVGDELLAVGVNVDLAPVLDVNDNPNNPVIGPRAFGTTPDVVQTSGLAFAVGLHEAGVIAVGKHFPGHGSTGTDSHFALSIVPKDRQALEAVELPPFRLAAASGIDAMMVAHVAYPALDPSGLPATVSAPIISGVLRGDLGFAGVVMTDDMGMTGISELMTPEEGAVRAVLAGADMVLCARLDLPGSCPASFLVRLRAGLLRAVLDGRIPMARIDEAVHRITALKAGYRVGPASGSGLAQVGSAVHKRVISEVLSAAGHP